MRRSWILEFVNYLKLNVFIGFYEKAWRSGIGQI